MCALELFFIRLIYHRIFDRRIKATIIQQKRRIGQLKTQVAQLQKCAADSKAEADIMKERLRQLDTTRMMSEKKGFLLKGMKAEMERREQETVQMREKYQSTIG